MNRKIVGILICMLLVATLILPVSGKIIVSSNINRNVIFSEYSFLENNNFVLTNGLDDFIVNIMAENHIPGLSASIIKNGSVFWTESYGYADISLNISVKDTTLFRLASISKTIVATAIMQLFEQGYFDLYDPINDYLPFQVNHPDFPSTNITFHMLCTHTSSIRDNWIVIPRIDGDPTIPLGEYLEEYLTPGGDFYYPTLNFYTEEPGTIYGYSNIGAALIGYLVEVISNVSFDEYCENYVFQPLDMYETAWFLADLNVSNIAVPYRWNGEKYLAYPHHCTNAYPAGNLRTSVTQLSNFLLMMMSSGEYNSTQILQESTVNLMLSTQSPLNPNMGIIWRKYFIPGRVLWGHAGSFYGCRTQMFFEPETNIGAIILTNGQYDDIYWILIELFDFAENIPPNDPSIEGPSSGKTRVSYDYILNSTDPEEHDVSFYVEWGDNTITDWTDFVTSGTEITLTHKWSKQGDYIVKVKAKDSYGAESDWSEFEITIPRTRTSSYSFHWFFEHFPLLERLLTFLLL